MSFLFLHTIKHTLMRRKEVLINSSSYLSDSRNWRRISYDKPYKEFWKVYPRIGGTANTILASLLIHIFHELLFQENFKLFNHLEGQNHDEESDTCFSFDKTIALHSVKYLKSSSLFHEKVDVSLYFARS